MNAPPAVVRVEREGAILVITLNRPEVRNAIDAATAAALAEALDHLDADPAISLGVLTGAGGTFCSGMDLKAFVRGERPEIPGRGFGGLTESPPGKPIIAAVEGYALAGGCELVLACDMVVAAADARFGLPETKRGLVAGSGGLVRLPRKIPPQIAMEFALTGEQFGAEDGHRWGLVNRLTPPGGALAGALDLGRAIAANGPLAIRMTKRILVEQAAWPADEVWSRQEPLVESILASEDAREGAIAFAEKRAPVWRGR